jgi:hypothetical protein
VIKFLFLIALIFVVGAIVLAFWPLFLIGLILWLIFRNRRCPCPPR